MASLEKPSSLFTSVFLFLAWVVYSRNIVCGIFSASSGGGGGKMKSDITQSFVFILLLRVLIST